MKGCKETLPYICKKAGQVLEDEDSGCQAVSMLIPAMGRGDYRTSTMCPPWSKAAPLLSETFPLQISSGGIECFSTLRRTCFTVLCNLKLLFFFYKDKAVNEPIILYKNNGDHVMPHLTHHVMPLRMLGSPSS